MIVAEINGKAQSVLRLGELAKKLNRTTSALRKMEDRKILPLANFRMPDVMMPGGKTRQGDRIYTLTLAEKLIPIFEGITQGTPVTQEQKREIRALFEEELKS